MSQLICRSKINLLKVFNSRKYSHKVKEFFIQNRQSISNRVINSNEKVNQKFSRTLDIFKTLNSNYPNISNVSILNKSYDLKGNLNGCTVQLFFAKTNLSNYETKIHSNIYSVDLNNIATKINSIPIDEETDSSILAKSERNGKRVVVKLYNNCLLVEFWDSQGFKFSQSIQQCAKIYNNSFFGGISWSKNEDKIVFIAERQDIKNYAQYFEDSTDQSNSKSISTYYKYNYNHLNSNVTSSFGETLEGFKFPVICVLDLVTKKSTIIDFGKLVLNNSQCEEIKDLIDLYPACPIFNEDGASIILHGYHFPVEKLGLAYCLNRHTKLLCIHNYEELSKICSTLPENQDQKFKIENMQKDMYFAGFPKFSKEYKHLVFIGRKDEFHSHTSYFSINNNEQLCLTGYQNTFYNSGLIGEQDDLRLIMQGFEEGKDVIYSIPVNQNQVQNITKIESPDLKTANSTELMSISDDIAVINSSSTSEPPTVYICRMKDKVSWTKIDQLMFDNINKSETSQFITNLLKTIHIDTFKTNEGAEGYFIRSSETKGVPNLFESQKKTSNFSYPWRSSCLFSKRCIFKIQTFMA